jgi:hypothetical protein
MTSAQQDVRTTDTWNQCCLTGPRTTGRAVEKYVFFNFSSSIFVPFPGHSLPQDKTIFPPP